MIAWLDRFWWLGLRFQKGTFGDEVSERLHFGGFSGTVGECEFTKFDAPTNELYCEIDFEEDVFERLVC